MNSVISSQKTSAREQAGATAEGFLTIFLKKLTQISQAAHALALPQQTGMQRQDAAAMMKKTAAR